MNEIFAAIFARLQAELTGINIFDHVPQDIENSAYPLVRVDAVNTTDNGTDTEIGFVAECQIVTYSRYKGFKEINEICDQVFFALHRWNFPATISFGISGIRQTARTTNVNPDGLTRHGVQRYEIIFEPLPTT
tara:strand:- start:1049 stop:1447 length:399 start_codon:yes stop_codon:yes gene_type:complete